MATDDSRSNGLYVYTTSNTTLAEVAVGYNITLSGTVSEYRSSSSPYDLDGTELVSPTSLVVNSKLKYAGDVIPVVLGKDRTPPTQLFSALDVGPDGFLSVPNGVSNITSVNATLVPGTYGLDFWESLEGQLVTVRSDWYDESLHSLMHNFLGAKPHCSGLPRLLWRDMGSWRLARHR